MSDPRVSAQPEAQELTPEARDVLKRARRSFTVSMALLLVGFIAIGGALVYRATRDAPAASAEFAAEALRLPQGAEVVSATAADGSVTVTYRLGPATQIRVFDGGSGAMTGQMDLVFSE